MKDIFWSPLCRGLILQITTKKSGGFLEVTEEKKDLKKTLIVIFSAVVVVVLLGLGIFFLRKTEKEKAPPKVVGCIDRDKVLQTKGFKEAYKKMEKLRSEFAKKLQDTNKNLDPNNPEDKKKLAQLQKEYQDLIKKITQIRNKEYKRAEAAIATVAVEKHINAVLDKGIVVCGAVDITDDVVKLLDSGKEIKMPSDEELDKLQEKATIGYFDEAVIMELPKFREAAKKVKEYEAKLNKEFEEKSKNMSDEEKLMLGRALIQQRDQMKKDLYAPLFRQVHRVVVQVAESSDLDLVVNKERVMYGGKNITDKVVNALMKGDQE